MQILIENYLQSINDLRLLTSQFHLDSKPIEPDYQTINLVKIKWKTEKDDVSNGGYTKDILKKILSKV